jgi:hypothetical protein
MNKITPAEFITRAIERVPPYPTKTKYRHRGVRLDLLRKPFAKYYGGEIDLTVTLDDLIKQNVVIAVHAVWDTVLNEWRQKSRKLVEVERLEAFPDSRVPDENPILYLPNALPRVLKAHLSQPEEILAKILQPTLVAANG